MQPDIVAGSVFIDYELYDQRGSLPEAAGMDAKTQPHLLVLRGKYDLSFELAEPEAYRRDLPNAQIYVFNTGYFALDTAVDEIADLVRGFMSNKQ